MCMHTMNTHAHMHARMASTRVHIYIHVHTCTHVPSLQVDIHLRRAATMSTWHVNEHASVWSNLRGKDVMGEQDKWAWS